MKYIGKGKLITDSFIDIPEGSTVHINQYEDGDEFETTGDIYSESEQCDGGDGFDYKIVFQGISYDCYEDEVEII